MYKEKIERIQQYFFVIRELVSREIKRRYVRSYLGIFWSVLQPLLHMAVMSMIFSTMFKRNVENFPIYFLTGNILWSLFTGATNSAMTALVDNKNLLIKVKLPMMIFPLARVYSALVNLGYSLVAYVCMLIVFRNGVYWTMLFFPVIVGLELLFCIGIGNILSVAYAFFGDIKHLYGILLTLWMYMCALFYPVEGLPDQMRTVVIYNPMYNYIACARKCVMQGEMPTAFEFWYMVIWGVAVFALGQWVFNRNKNKVMQKL